MQYSLIDPYLHYGIMSWENTYPIRLTKVQTKENETNVYAAYFLVIIEKTVHRTSNFWIHLT